MFSNNVSMFGSLYQGCQTVEERGFEVDDQVHVGASYSEKIGTIVGLNKDFPFKAIVRLDHKNGGATTCYIKSEHLSIYSKNESVYSKNDLLSRVDSSLVNLHRSLYQGCETIAERGFEVGDQVHVGASYSEKFGTIVGLDKEFPFKAQVRLDHKNGGATTCWIKSEYLLKLS